MCRNLYFSQGPSHSISVSFALWSFGGVVSPLVCQSVIATGVPWPNFYFGSLVLSALNTVFLACTFRPTINEFSKDRREARLLERQSDSEVQASKEVLPSPVCSSPVETARPEPSRSNTLRLAIRMPYQWAISVFAWLYCGTETTTQGFMVSYLLAVRGANPKTAGYVTAGFWGGITIGRLLWGRYAARLSFSWRKYAVQLCLGM
ncbi:hypothetical protein HGRIS_007622 [Hohenbuehelia grisea]|uniref:Uncharacterized protein n=1 Tax=Hohenbuehelia grisea TaxID=104357 RepID=A0ABR3J5U1_9AGAR